MMLRFGAKHVLVLMRKSLFSVILLTTVAISTSDVLPIFSIKQLEPELDRQDDKVHDNDLSGRFHNDDIPNDIYYKVSIGPSHKTYTPLLIPQKSNFVYVEQDNNHHEDGERERIVKKEKYDEEGYRKEQWHNYPRQLDRLQKYLYQQHQYDTDFKKNPDELDDINNNVYEIATNDNQQTAHDLLDAVVAATSPLFILKIRLAYLKEDQNAENDYERTLPIEILPNDIHNEKDEENLDPIISAVKVKREEKINSALSDLNKTTENKKNIKKRIFSLWSRLQSLSHKGHELHHRRHLHAFYGFPDDDASGGGAGALTAETRASFMRPPGSPLRWG